MLRAEDHLALLATVRLRSCEVADRVLLRDWPHQRSRLELGQHLLVVAVKVVRVALQRGTRLTGEVVMLFTDLLGRSSHFATVVLLLKQHQLLALFYVLVARSLHHEAGLPVDLPGAPRLRLQPSQRVSNIDLVCVVDRPQLAVFEATASEIHASNADRLVCVVPHLYHHVDVGLGCRRGLPFGRGVPQQRQLRACASLQGLDRLCVPLMLPRRRQQVVWSVYRTMI